MKKIIFLAFVTLFTLSASMVFGEDPDKNTDTEKTTVTEEKAVSEETETTLSDKEVDRITERVEEIRNMDKSDLTADEKSELKKELKDMKKDVKKRDGAIYIGGSTLLLIIILVILLT
ncbi:MAG: hypothetical protein ACLFN1_03830 [Bacteroidales bacterium]